VAGDGEQPASLTALCALCCGASDGGDRRLWDDAFSGRLYLPEYRALLRAIQARILDLSNDSVPAA